MEIIIQASIKPKLEHYEECKKALLELQKSTTREDGCLQFDILESEEGDGKIYFYERFKDQACFELHFTYQYTKDVFTAYENWLEEDVNITRLKKAQ